MNWYDTLETTIWVFVLTSVQTSRRKMNDKQFKNFTICILHIMNHTNDQKSRNCKSVTKIAYV